LPGPKPVGPDVREAIGQFRSAPLDLRAELCKQLIDGTPRADLVTVIEEIYGDRSFHALAGFQNIRRELGLQVAATIDWEAGRLNRARSRMRRSSEALMRKGVRSEAAFSLYLEAEILAEAEDHRSALDCLERALLLVKGEECRLLEALVSQSRGYSLWFEDELPGAIREFGKALKTWLEMGYGDGITASWNNLASLYELSGNPVRAESCYLEALSGVTANTPPEIRGQLFLNYALFSHDQGNRETARRFLELARPMRTFLGDEFVFAEAVLMSRPELLARLQASNADAAIRIYLVRAELQAEAGDTKSAFASVSKAWSEAFRLRRKALARQSAFCLANLYEREARHGEAAAILGDLLREDELLGFSDELFPFSSISDPIVEGLVRNLVLGDQAGSARHLLRELGQLRKEKIHLLLDRPPPIEVAPTSSGQLAAAADRSFLRVQREGPVSRSGIGLPPQTALLELWPDGKRVYAWLESPAGTRFLVLDFPQDVAETVRELTEGFEKAVSVLPPPPSRNLTRQIYRAIFDPIVPDLAGVLRLILVPHRSLLDLPFELLENDSGEPILSRFAVSYLPDVDADFRTSMRFAGPPLAYVSADLGTLSARSARLRLRSLDQVRLFDSLDELLDRGSAPWIHVADHFRPDPLFWTLSSFGNSGRETRLDRFIRKPLNCALLSLAVCDAGGAGDGLFPFSFGLAEFLLHSGAESMVISRWPLDERSADLLMDFHVLAQAGIPFDEALTEVRRRAMSRMPSGWGQDRAHPFFWSGLIYVGWPGKRLPGSGQTEPLIGDGVAAPSIVGGLFLAALLAALRLRAAASGLRRGGPVVHRQGRSGLDQVESRITGLHGP